MALPETVRVKISSEAAESISITAVVVREMPARELIEAMLGVTGKDAARVHELLLRGSLVAGASRFRWEGWDADRAAIDAMLATFPDPDSSRAFTRAWCVRAALKSRGARIEITREAARERRLFRRASFWDGLMDVAEAASPRYAGYSYKDRADHYALNLAPADAARIRDGAAMLRYSGLAAQIRNAAIDSAEFWVERR